MRSGLPDATLHSILRLDRLPRSLRVHGAAEFYWLVIEGEHPELCFNDPGREIGLVVTVDEQVFGRVLLGRSDFAEAVSRGHIQLVGSPNLVRDFPTWIGVTHFARDAVPQHRLEPASYAV